MDGLSETASVIAVSQYYLDVKNAKTDIKRLQNQIELFLKVTESTTDILDGPHGDRLKASGKLPRLDFKPKDGCMGKLMSRLHLRELKWPFDKKEFETTISNLEQNRQLLSSALLVDNTTELLQMYSKFDLAKLPVTMEATSYPYIDDGEPRCLPGTREKVLNEIYSWIGDPNGKCINWLCGMAGTGKSTISRTVADPKPERSIPCASFFFKRGQGNRGRADLLFSTIARQLFDQLPATFGQQLRKAMEDDMPRSLQDQFQRLILEPFKNCNADKVPGMILIIIDALDECGQGKQISQIIGLLSQAREVTSTQLKFFVTSRPELPIRPAFENLGNAHDDLVLHEIPLPEVKSDMSAYLNFELEEIRDKFNKSVPSTITISDDWPCVPDVDHLVNIAIPLFIFASTVCNFIRDNVTDSPKTKLERFLNLKRRSILPSFTACTYLVRSDYVQRDDDDKANVLARFQEIVGSSILLADNLTTVALGRLINSQPESIELYLNSLHSVLQVPSDRSKPEQNVFWVNEQKVHARLADSCIRLLRNDKTLRRDICGLKAPGFLRQRSIKDDDKIHQFIEIHLLHWLEALALIGRIGESIKMMQDMLSAVDETGGSKVAAFFHDAKRFIQKSRSGIEAAPLQVYHSALVFAPQRSILRNVFIDQIPDWIVSLPEVDLDWDACLEILDCKIPMVELLLRGPNGELAGTSQGSNYIQVWDTMAGTYTALESHGGNTFTTLCGHEGRVRTLAWVTEPSLASGSEDGTIRLWDIVTKQFESGIKEVSYLAWEPKGDRLVVSFHDKFNTQIWDTTTATPCTLEGHTDFIEAVEWGPNGQLASAVHADGIRIWDIATGVNSPVVLKGLTDSSIEALVWRSEEQLLSVADGEYCIRLWSTREGTCITVIETMPSCGYIKCLSANEEGSTIQTDIGTYKIGKLGHEPECEQTVEHSGWGLIENRTWISLNSRGMIWLPPDRRGWQSAIEGIKLAIVSRSGRATVMVFAAPDSVCL
ncbi:hypothetical protein BX600DRAFT_519740 [Xylariales sp. PMI_506]|nr:hypothetical protein BX600DRAFT_519740 [Xylariales sp. PMI_506]